jgi:hypothetical protein
MTFSLLHLFIALLFGFGAGITFACGSFLYLNRRRPDAVDAAETAFRKL